MNMERRQFVAVMGSIAASFGASSVVAEDNKIVEPVHRVANAANSLEPTPLPPLDRALKIAEDGLVNCRANINDYTALLVKREHIARASATRRGSAPRGRRRVPAPSPQ